MSAKLKTLEELYRNPWMTDDQWECAMLLCDLFRGFHHCAEIKPHAYGIHTNMWGCKLASFDFDYLTRLVLFCHDRCIRCEILPSGPGLVKIALWKRHTRKGDMSRRHPTIDQAIETHRKQWSEQAIDEEGQETRAEEHADTDELRTDDAMPDGPELRPGPSPVTSDCSGQEET